MGHFVGYFFKKKGKSPFSPGFLSYGLKPFFDKFNQPVMTHVFVCLFRHLKIDYLT